MRSRRLAGARAGRRSTAGPPGWCWPVSRRERAPRGAGEGPGERTGCGGARRSSTRVRWTARRSGQRRVDLPCDDGRCHPARLPCCHVVVERHGPGLEPSASLRIVNDSMPLRSATLPRLEHPLPAGRDPGRGPDQLGGHLLSARIHAGNSSSTQATIPDADQQHQRDRQPGDGEPGHDPGAARDGHRGEREHRRHPHRVDVQQQRGDVAAQRQGPPAWRPGRRHARDQAAGHRRGRRTAWRRRAGRCPGTPWRRTGPRARRSGPAAPR